MCSPCVFSYNTQHVHAAKNTEEKISIWSTGLFSSSELANELPRIRHNAVCKLLCFFSPLSLSSLRTIIGPISHVQNCCEVKFPTGVACRRYGLYECLGAPDVWGKTIRLNISHVPTSPLSLYLPPLIFQNHWSRSQTYPLFRVFLFFFFFFLTRERRAVKRVLNKFSSDQ